VESKQVIEELYDSDYSAMLIDLDNTIYPYNISHKNALNRCEERFTLLFPNSNFTLEYNTARSMVHARLNGQAAMHSRLLYFQQMFDIVSGRNRSDLSLEFEELYWDAYLESMCPDNGILQILNVAEELSIQICVVTDLTAQIQHKKLIKLGLQHKIKYLVSSEEAGVEKPHPFIFELALGKMGVKASDAVMIGDSETRDIIGAKNCGIHAIHYVANEI
jgi:HAD superfamily hydrolase (TIGR01509 family)